MDLSIVIVNYNSLNFLLNCLDSIKRSLRDSRLKYEIIVIDNTSIDNSQKIIKELPGVKMISNKKNVGFGNACNQGIKYALGKFILLLNPDIVVLDRAIEKLINLLKGRRGFIGGKLLNQDSTVQPSCGLFFSLPVVATMLFLQGERLRVTKFSPEKTGKVDWVSGACLAGRKSDFLKTGGFDKNIFLYMEEVDLLFRARSKHLPCFFYKDAEFIHYGAAISGRTQAIKNIFKGLIYFYKKHYSARAVLILKFLLYIKAIIGISIGVITFNKKLENQYRLAINYI